MIDDTSKEFISRHIGPNTSDQEEMLKAISLKSINDLIENTVPKNILIKDNLKIDEPMSENDALKKLKLLSKNNQVFRNFIGILILAPFFLSQKFFVKYKSQSGWRNNSKKYLLY